MPSKLVLSHPFYTQSKARGFHQRLGWGFRPVLVFIDVCRAYWAEGSPLSLLNNQAEGGGAHAPESMRRLLAAARMGQIPVIWCQVRYAHPEMVDGVIQYKKSPGISIWQEGDLRGMDAWMPGLGPNEDDTVILKKNPSAFLSTNLAGQLTSLGADSIVLCGVSTSGCVRATAVDAMGYGFRCAVVDEASGDRSRMIQQATLFDLDARFADVVDETEAVDKLKGGWKDRI